MMMTPFKARFLAASAALCILLPLTAAAQSDFNFNTTVDFADDNPITVNVVAGCDTGTGSSDDIAEADGAVALNVAGYAADDVCLVAPSAVPPLYSVTPSAGCIIAATPVDQADSDCTLLFELIEADIEVTVVENSADPVVAGSGPDNISYTYTVTNLGPGGATGAVSNLVVNLSIAPGLGCSTPTASKGSVAIIAGDTAQWSGLDLVLDESATLDLLCTVDSNAQHGAVLTGVLTLISMDQVDPNPDNNSATGDTTIIREATFDVTKIWDGGEVEVTLTCDGVAVSTGFTSGLMASFTYGGFANGVNCVVTETVPDGFAPSYSADCDVTGVLSGSVYSCEITNAATVARFQVTKDFSDGSTDDVEVTLTCNTGLPLEQSLTIAGGDDFGVIFVVTDYIDGTMSCAVTEVTNTPG
jgi:hypothetical protein